MQKIEETRERRERKRVGEIVQGNSAVEQFILFVFCHEVEGDTSELYPCASYEFCVTAATEQL